MAKHIFLTILIFSLTISATAWILYGGNNSEECVYTIYIRTGSMLNAGTNANISLTLEDEDGKKFHVPELVSWGGLMGSGHDYYERGALDVFSGRGTWRISSPPCRLNLTSNGEGALHAWYCESVEVTATGPHTPCTQSLFYVKQWLSKDHLESTIDNCNKLENKQKGKRHIVTKDQSYVSTTK